MSHAGMSTADSLIGTTLAGRYRVEARVGSGAMGAVYRAEQAGLGRHVALKIVNRDRQVDNATVQRFRREATALSALNHPNTVRVFDFGSTAGGLLYLAMELLEGEPLTDLLVREGPLPLTQAIAIIQQVLRSIGEAHARGIVHRDLKPDNVYLARVPAEPAPIVKVLDFGIAKAVEGVRKIDQFETLDGTVFGTPRYMSPEQAAGRALDPRSDLYSVGIMLYELIAGRPPFVDNDAVVVMARHIRDKPEPLGRLAPCVIPPSLEAVVTRALAKQRDERFQSAEEFEQALQRCLPDVEDLTRSPLARVLNKRRVWAVAAGLALAAAAGGGAFWQGHFKQPVSAEDAHPSGIVATPLPSTTVTQAATAPALQPTLPSSTLIAPPPEATSEASPVSIVSVRTTPPAAAVLQDGAELGVTPLDVSMNKGSTMTLLLKKKGFAERRLELRAGDGERLVTLHRLEERSHEDRPRTRAAGSRRTRERISTKAAANPEPPAAVPVNPAPASSDRRSPYERF
jgi:serine/threonine-protein kinase